MLSGFYPFRLWMLNGRPLRGAYELKNNHCYVAVGTSYHLVPCKGDFHRTRVDVKLHTDLYLAFAKVSTN